MARIPAEESRRLIRACRALWRLFTVGGLLGVGFLLLGAIAVGLHDPQRHGDQLPPRISAVALTALALASAAGALSCMVDGYIEARECSKSVRCLV